VFLKGGPGEGDPFLDDFGDGPGVLADLPLGLGGEAELEEVEEVVQILLPVELGVEVQGKDHPGHLPGHALLQKGPVGPVGLLLHLP